MPAHIRTGDMVIVNSGKSAWKRTPDGKKYKDTTPRKVLKVLPGQDRVIVEGVNVRRKAVKPSQTNQQGGFVDEAMPIHVSNVQPAVDGKGTRVRFVTEADGSKKRVAARNGEQIGELLKKPKKD